MLITENGIATTDEVLRSDFLRAHAAEIHAARARGLPVLGYLYWSLIDNFEWAFGMTQQFGLAAVSPVTRERTVRPAALLFDEIRHGERRAEPSR